ncbi:Metal-dependent hydrolase, endonuclease/exonuclease/phosphatase family [Catalinimonas alkaloidigena]|uniref:Metal-dependent hydrolase, endonuclease/exonuclease/phosphatase family n=1 Tax=Catalinimonas alkaloidigena TaxID=1075417 RepID=A0A1G9F485_9BACT|nr:endonuclease/exonuclease/phosphatase family protein [Catalinimonas alkaloidigena]SDK83259.1 Metal-dependent hydrolase, endonuclease/exonuclease/phosphatase family [Catalinimonas alkaloidigena]
MNRLRDVTGSRSAQRRRRQLRKSDLLMAGLYGVLYLMPFIKPGGSLWWIGVSGLGILPALLLHLLLLLVGLLRRPWTTQLPLLFALLMGLPYLWATFGKGGSAPLPTDEVKVLTYNVKQFERDAYHPREKDAEPRSPQVIDQEVAWIAAQGADIVVIQEFYDFEGSPLFNMRERFRENGYRYQAFDPYIVSRSGKINHYVGTMVMSRHPIIASGLMPNSISAHLNQNLWTDIALPSDTVRFYGVHMQSYGLRPENRDTWFEQIRDGLSRRSDQTVALREHMLQSPYPVMVCGDMNDTPYSYTYWQMRMHLANAFEKGGQGIGLTFPSVWPLWRIDHMFAAEAFQCTDYQVFDQVHFSDHLPALGTFRFSARD